MLKKQIFIILTSWISVFSVVAQSQTATNNPTSQTEDTIVIKKNVTIEKAYTPNIREVSKINEIPAMQEPEIEVEPAIYSNYSTLLTPNFEIRTLESARLKQSPIPNYKNGFFRLGFGFIWHSLLDLNVPIITKPKYSFDLSINHKGLFSNKSTDMMHHKSDGALAFTRHFEKGDFFVGGGYSFRGFNYYGKNELLANESYTFNNQTVVGSDYFTKMASIHTWNATLGYKSLPDEESLNRFSIQVEYDGLQGNAGLGEHFISTNAKYQRSLDENNWGIDFKMQNAIYNTNKINTFATAPTLQNHIFLLNPYFQFIQERWFLRVGFNGYFSTTGQVFVPSADIKANFAIIKKALFIYAGIEGDYQANTLQNTLNLNHYIDLNQNFKNTYTPLDVYGGFKIKFIHNLLTDIYVSYKMKKNQIFFVNQTMTDAANNVVMSNVFSSIYDNANKLTAGIKINYSLNDLLAFNVDGRYNHWETKNVEEAWGMPEWEVNVGANMKFGKRMSADLSTYVATGRKALKYNADGSVAIHKLGTLYDLNLGFNYNHNSKLGMFIKLNNILHCRAEQWYGYKQTGIHGLLGITYSF